MHTSRPAAMLLLVLAAGSAAAQARPDTAVLTPVTITASRTEARQSVATVSSTVLWGEALRSRGITTLAAALREVPGAALVRAGAPGSEAALHFRGGERDYVQVLIDGVTVNQPGGSFDFANLTLDDVERIEIVRGPASVLYGADAMTGVIQIFTRSPARERRGEVAARVGERGTIDTDAMLTGSVGGAAFSLGGGHHRSDGLYTLNNEWRSDGASAGLRLGAAARTAAFTARYGDARYHYPTEFWGAPLDSNAFSTERRLTLGFAGAHDLSGSIDAHLSAGMSRHQSISTDPADGPDDFASRFEAFSTRRSIDARLDIRPTPGATLSLGADFDWQRSEGTGEDPADPSFRRWSRGGYAQLVGSAAGRWSYSLGARTEDNQRFGTLSSLRAASGLRLLDATTLRASAGTAFKEPTFCELSGCGFAAANTGLDPERSRSWEVGMEQGLGGSVVVAATYFDQEFRDLIQFSAIPDPPGSQYRNARSAYANGWELEARAGRTGGPSVRASVTTLDAVIRAGDGAPASRFLRRPGRSASAVVSAPLGGGMILTTDVAYVGRRDDNLFSPTGSERVRMDPYTLVGLAASYAPPRPAGRFARNPLPVELHARVDNLFDESYEAIAGFATMGRRVSLGARVGFDW